MVARGRSMGDMAIEEKEADQDRESRPPPPTRGEGLLGDEPEAEWGGPEAGRE